MFIESCSHTDRGLLRARNEDSLLCDARLRLFAVADGMGGHAGGEVASAIAIRTLQTDATRSAIPSADAEVSRTAISPTDAALGLPLTRDALVGAVAAANQAILAAARENPELEGMGTTLTVLAVDRGEAAWAHVGDSRLYLYREDTLRQLSRDQTWVQQQVDAGLLDAEQARSHPYASMLVQALGVKERVQPEACSLPCYPGDRFLLCSDGLTGMLRDTEIAEILRSSGTCEAAVLELIERANRNGGADNITVVLVAVRTDRPTDSPYSSSAAPESRR